MKSIHPIAVCLLIVSSVWAICERPEIAVKRFPEVKKGSLFHEVARPFLKEMRIEEQDNEIIKGKGRIGTMKVNFKLYRMHSKDGGVLASEYQRKIKKLALNNIIHLHDNSVDKSPTNGHNAKLIACETGHFVERTARGTRQEKVYILVITPYMKLDFEYGSHAPQTSNGIVALMETEPLERLVFYHAIAMSLVNLHSRSKTHNDISPAAIVANKDLTLANLIDFELTRDSGSNSSKIKGDQKFFDPHRFKIFNNQMLINSKKKTDISSPKVDIWALGLTFFYLECESQSADSDLPMFLSKAYAHGFASRIQLITSGQSQCFKNSEITRIKTENQESILTLLAEMLRFRRKDRKITAEQVAEKLQRLIRVAAANEKRVSFNFDLHRNTWDEGSGYIAPLKRTPKNLNHREKILLRPVVKLGKAEDFSDDEFDLFDPRKYYQGGDSFEDSDDEMLKLGKSGFISNEDRKHIMKLQKDDHENEKRRNFNAQNFRATYDNLEDYVPEKYESEKESGPLVSIWNQPYQETKSYPESEDSESEDDPYILNLMAQMRNKPQNGLLTTENNANVSNPSIALPIPIIQNNQNGFGNQFAHNNNLGRRPRITIGSQANFVRAPKNNNVVLQEDEKDLKTII